MSRTAQPLAVAERNGALQHNPQRFTGALPASGVLGDPPEHLTEAQRKVWFETVENAVPGVLTSADRFIVETVCGLMAELRANPAKFSAQMAGRLTTCLAHLGMTPSGRRGVSPPSGAKPAAPKAGFDDF